jgi:AraC family transcriptional regulator, positive regulator of tynA and feaB
MHPSAEFVRSSQLAYEEWRVLLCSLAARYHPEGVDPRAFAGSLHARTICGFEAIDLSCNAPRVERTLRDVRLDGVGHYYALFQLSGQSKVNQNDQAVVLDVGAVALVDSSRPVTYFSEIATSRWLSLHLPRKSLVSHLGLEPQGGLCRHAGALAAGLLFNLVLDAVNNGLTSSKPTEPYMHLAVYDLLGALFADSPQVSVSSHTDKLFTRACGIIKGRFVDPNLGPSEVAAELGISLRYLQKLFTVRGSTCGQFIQSTRLNYAAGLLRRRTLMKTRLPLSEIAYACGFRDYTYFARAFRNRFGYPPGAAEDDTERGRLASTRDDGGKFAC